MLSSATQDFALEAASDGVIVYGISNRHGATREQWFDEVFSSLSQQLGVTFLKSSYSNSELRFDVQDIGRDEYLNLDGGEPSLIIDNGGGKFLWKSSKDTRQYGGVQDQLTVSRAVLRSLGLSYPGGSPWNENIQETILSSIKTQQGLYGHTFYPAEADIEALHQLYGHTPVSSQRSVDHVVDLDEELVVALDGRVDYIYISLKGIDATNKSSIDYDEWGPIYNDYKNASIAGFNPWEGDVIFVERTLMSPYDGNDAKTSDWISTQELSKNLSLIYSGVPSEEHLVRLSGSEVIYNDAGKIMLNANGTEEGLGPMYGVNNYLISFLDLGGVVTRELPYGAFKTYASSGDDRILEYENINIDKSREYSIEIDGEINIRMISGDSSRAQSSFIASIRSNFAYLGSSGSDRLLGSQGANGEAWAHDLIRSRRRLLVSGGRDVMNGGLVMTNSEVATGTTSLTGGADILYGSGKPNNNDDEVDQPLSSRTTTPQPTHRQAPQRCY